MVAEPVQATLENLNYLYNGVLRFITDQKEHLTKSEYVEKASHLNPFTSLISDPVVAPPERHAYDAVNTFFDKVSKKKLILCTTVLTIGCGLTVAYSYRRDKIPSNSRDASHRKRRVPKLRNGARRDVVLVIGSPTEPLTRLIALDLEKRGFIVYLTILDAKDLKYVESNTITDDLNYLNLNDSYSFEVQLTKFSKLLEAPVVPFQGAHPHHLRLLGCIFTPSLYFPIGPVEHITIASWTKVTERFHVILKLLSSGLIALIRKQQPHCKILVMTSNVLSSLNLPYHAPETYYQKSVQNLFTSLTREVKQHRISVTQIKLGNLQISSAPTKTGVNASSSVSNLISSEIRSWNTDMQNLYGEKFAKTNPTKSYGGRSRFLGLRSGSDSLRDLYYQTFDLLCPSIVAKMNPAVVYCGSGARIYDWIASVLPVNFVSWLLT
jgi:hypothetical protein